MSVQISCRLSDPQLDANQSSGQRQLAIAISAPVPAQSHSPLNLCLILDHSGSMAGRPLDTVKRAACNLLNHMDWQDRISVIGFDHKAKVVVPNQPVDYVEKIKSDIYALKAGGGTCIDEGIKLGLQELAKGKDGRVSQAFVLTDGENEHGSNERCLQFAYLAAEYNVTLHALGFGDYWNQDVLEQIADAGGGSLAYIPEPAAAEQEFQRLLKRAQSVGFTNAHLLMELAPGVRLAELKPIAQVAPETVELNHSQTDNLVTVRVGDLLTDMERVILVNLYINYQPHSSTLPIANLQVRYDDPSTGQVGCLSARVSATAAVVGAYTPQMDQKVQTHFLALAKYRQTQIAEAKLKEGDTAAAATMLQSAAKTALQMGDRQGATVLQANATRLQSGTALSEAERKQTRIVAKTVLNLNS
ncbi:MAG: vWA domain-containing protein [Pseudanabaenaceae cyanobacterium]